MTRPAKRDGGGRGVSTPPPPEAAGGMPRNPLIRKGRESRGRRAGEETGGTGPTKAVERS